MLDVGSPHGWRLLTRLGEAQILLPALLVLVGWYLLRHRDGRVAAAWLLGVGGATLLTTITKVAFLGWGIGSAAFDFTGISGHAMFASAVLPLLVAGFASTAPSQVRRAALVLAYLLAAVVAYSRLVVRAHSGSEALAGLALGTLASALALRSAAAPRSHAPKALLLALAAWVSVATAGAPPSPTHGYVVRLSLALSGRSQPYTRAMLLQRSRAAQQLTQD